MKYIYNMKEISLFIMLTFCVSLSSNAQWYALKFKKTKAQLNGPTIFQKDENGKIIFYEVVAADSIPRDTLWKNAKIWMKSILNEKGDKITDEQYMYGTLEANTSFMVYVASMISKMPHGKIFYDVSLDVKENKYRYSFTNFRFQYYKQDRKDLKYHPVPNKYKALEVQKFGGHQMAWESHKYEVKRRIEGQISYLKKEIIKINKPKTAILDSFYIKPVIKTKEW